MHKFHVRIAEVWIRTVEVEMPDNLYSMGDPKDSAVTLAMTSIDPTEINFEYSHELSPDSWWAEEVEDQNGSSRKEGSSKI